MDFKRKFQHTWRNLIKIEFLFSPIIIDDFEKKLNFLDTFRWDIKYQRFVPNRKQTRFLDRRLPLPDFLPLTDQIHFCVRIWKSKATIFNTKKNTNTKKKVLMQSPCPANFGWNSSAAWLWNWRGMALFTFWEATWFKFILTSGIERE